MTQAFELKRVRNISPSGGEELGAALAACAEARESSFREKPNSLVSFWGDTVAQIYFLAAEAYEQGASVTLGHNRTDRYMTRARELRAAAERLISEADAEREKTESERMMAAFVDGYQGGDASRYSFDSREAFLVGKHFADAAMPIPESVRVLRDKRGKHWIEADGCRYSVDYPGGRVDAATVSLVG